MTQEATSNPVELFGKATSGVTKIVAGIKQEQLQAPTPCTEWNVQVLLNHLIGGAENFAKAMSGAPVSTGDTGSSQSSETNVANLTQGYRAAITSALEAPRAPGAIAKKINTPIGEMAAGEFLALNFMDHFVHGWDLAKATGQDANLDPALAEICYAMFVPDMTDMGRAHGVFGPAVAVADNASTPDKLLGSMGRQP